MRLIIRVVLAFYLVASALGNESAVYAWFSHNLGVMVILFAAICGLSVLAALLIFIAPQIGRWFAIASQVPQLFQIVTPVGAFGTYLAYPLEIGVEIMPEQTGWHVDAVHKFRDASGFVGFIGHPRGGAHVGYALVLNLTALAVALMAFYSVRKSPNQPPLQTPTSGTPTAGAPVAPPPGAAGR